MSTHAFFAPSSAVGWMNCPGFEAERSSSEAAAEGTVAHSIAAEALEQNGEIAWLLEGAKINEDGFKIEVTREMLDNIKRYVDFIMVLEGERHIEVALPLQGITGEEDAFGTADCVVLMGDELHVVDLKYGFAPVDVKDNPQLQIYAAAALEFFDPDGARFTKVTTTIFQPRANNIASATYDRKSIERFADLAWEKAHEHGLLTAELNPGEAQCKWCKHAGKCEAQANRALAIITDDFVDLTRDTLDEQMQAAIKLVDHVDAGTLARMMRAAPFIEQWMEAIQNRSKQLLEAGADVPGFKLVAGRAGIRKWDDAERAATALSAMGVDEDVMYEKSLISPTKAEKALDKKQWEAMSAHVVRAAPKTEVAPVGDKRPAISVLSFDNLTSGA